MTARVLTVAQVAEQTGYSEYHIRRLLRSGHIAARQLTPKARWLIPIEEVERISRPEKDA